MQKPKSKYQRSHHVRISAVAIALATVFHVSGLAHSNYGKERAVVAPSFSYALQSSFNNLERENETARHMVRFDENMRLPSISGV